MLQAELEANPSMKFAMLPASSLLMVPGAKPSGTSPLLWQFVCRAAAMSGLDSCPAWCEGSWLPEKALATALVVGQRKGRTWRTLWWKHPSVSNETWPTLNHIKTRFENLKSVHKEDYWNEELLLVSRIPGFGAGRHSIWPVSESLWKGPEPPIDCKAGLAPDPLPCLLPSLPSKLLCLGSEPSAIKALDSKLANAEAFAWVLWKLSAGRLPTLPWGHWELPESGKPMLQAELEANPSVKFALLPAPSLLMVPGAKPSGTSPLLCQFDCCAAALSGLDSCPASCEGSWLPEKALATTLVVGQRKGRTLWWKHPSVSNETWQTLNHIKTRFEILKSVHKGDYWNEELLLVSRIPGFGAGRHSIWPVSESLWKGPEPPVDCKAG